MKGLAQANSTGIEEEARICDPGGHGLFFPLIQGEQEWNWILRAVLYSMALCYLFLGVNIVADKFVQSIEAITSKRRRVREKGTGRVVTVAVWNGTVANLTLMALGSSAPEILLSIVETVVRNDFHSGELGPSTIVGSAAFNLFMIIAVCIMAIPSTELRAIKENGVFAVTAVFSLLAYAWLVFIVQVSSPDIVEIWEGVLTLAFLPVLIWISYAADVGMWPFKKKVQVHKGKIEGAAAPVQDAGYEDYPDYHGYGDYDLHTQRPFGYPQGPAGGGVAAFFSGDVGGGPHVMTDERGEPLGGEAGMLSFGEDYKEVSAGFQRKGIMMPVYRQNGTTGIVTCKYHTEALTAVPGYDYVHSDGELRFEHGSAWAEAYVELLPKRLGEHSDQFQIVLEDVEGGAVFNPYGDGGEERCVLTVTILNENDTLAEQSMALRAGRALDGCLNLDSLRRGTSDWRTEIVNAIFEVGDEDGEPPSLSDYAMHAICLPWKVLFAALVPPSAYMGGWLCFSFSLMAIGGLTTIVIDFAELFGCVTGIEDSITAITFVALGTSMPDLFASVSAAKTDETADASIVNVTGSNSVNVFVGIGLPWTMAAIYWHVQGPTEDWVNKYSSSMYSRNFAQAYPDGGFIVPGGDLAFGVVVFTIAALLALALICIRRVMYGGELGGPFGPKVLSSAMLTLLWLFYVGLYIWKVVSGPVDLWSQVSAIFVALMVLENVLLLAALVVFLLSRRGRGAGPAEPDEDEEKPAAPPPLPPPLLPTGDLRHAGRSAGHAARAGRLQVAGPPQHFEAGIMDGAPMLSAEHLAPMVSAMAVSKAISFSSAVMVCLAANRLKRPVQLRAALRQAPPPPRPPQALPQRPAGLPPAYSVSGLGAPPAPPVATLQRSNSFYSVDSGGGPAAAPAGGHSNAPGGAASAMRSVGGRVAGWVGDHGADGVALCVAGLAAAQMS